jgi:protection-of-telomeres protein 1
MLHSPGLRNTVRAAYPEMQLSTVSEIIYNPRLNAQSLKYNDFKLPFLNCKHRARVRVVDFFPPVLELFAHRISDPSWDKRNKRSDAGHGQGKDRWEWGFVLLLEDAKVPANTVSEKLRVVVSNDAGQYLLGMNAREYGFPCYFKSTANRCVVSNKICEH